MKIIAEVGSNWKSKQDCELSIERAKLAGAHAVKFQLFTFQELHGPVASAFSYGQNPCLDPVWIPALARHCEANEIEFMCTAFSEAGYRIIDPFVETHKIASAELTDFKLLEQVNKFKKPVILSTAGSDLIEEIGEAVSILRDCPLVLMFCVADYPARVVDFRQLQRMKNYFGNDYSYGYSDHTIDVNNIPIKAKQLGCSVIEKHVNFTSHKDTPDAQHSLNFEEFALMSSLLMGEDITIDDVASITNREMIKRHKRRFIVTKEIKAGEKFVIGQNIDIFRSLKSSLNPVSTFRAWEVQGKTANKDKIVGEAVSYQDVEVEFE